MSRVSVPSVVLGLSVVVALAFAAAFVYVNFIATRSLSQVEVSVLEVNDVGSSPREVTFAGAELAPIQALLDRYNDPLEDAYASPDLGCEDGASVKATFEFTNGTTKTIDINSCLDDEGFRAEFVELVR